MNENHPADNHPRSSETESGDNNWYSGWEDFSGQTEAEPDTTPSASFPSAQDAAPAEDMWHPVPHPHALSIDELVQDAQQSLQGNTPPAAEAPPSPKIDLPAWSVKTFTPQAQATAPQPPSAPAPEAEEPLLDVPELVSLIQELNQCNSALLDRVAQLEESLEQAKQTAGLGDRPTPRSEAGTPAALLQELENAQQTAQKQQILIENLHSQLAHSHERITHLEKSCAALQQQQADYEQELAQRAYAYQDLQIRLQRQQRYTLQFKAALEQSLEMAAISQDFGHLPTLEDVAAVGAIAPPTQPPEAPTTPTSPAPRTPLLPKVSHIQPWSSRSNPSGLPAKLDGFVGQSLTPDEAVPSPAQLMGDRALSISDGPVALPATGDDSSSASDTSPSVDAELQAAAEALKTASAELQTLFNNALSPAPLPDDASSPSELKAWQDLVQIADVSVEDVLQASQAPAPVDAAPTPPQKPRPTLSMPSELFRQKGTPSAPSTSPQNPGIQAFTPAPHLQPGSSDASPAPRLYPFRPLKKIDSIAAVDLPSFPANQG